MKYCPICKNEKNESDFAKKGKGRQCYCKLCANEKHRELYQQNKEHYKGYALAAKWQIRANALKFVMEVSKSGCEQCSEKDFSCLDFDHVDPSQKKHDIGHMIGQGYSIKRIEEELKKCRILCSNCHRKRTAKQYRWYETLIPYMKN